MIFAVTLQNLDLATCQAQGPKNIIYSTLCMLCSSVQGASITCVTLYPKVRQENYAYILKTSFDAGIE